MLHPQVKAFLDQLAESSAPKLWEVTVEDAREMYRVLNQLANPQDVTIGKTENQTVPGPAGEIPIRIYSPVAAGRSALPGLVFFHGGGFVLGDLDTYDPLCRQLANSSGCRVVSVDYRLAPEHPFPAAVEDAFAALRAIEQNAGAMGIDANRLAVGGDSAGGNLAAVTTLLARKGNPRIAYQLLIYPVVEIGAQTASMTDNAEGYLLDRATMDWFNKSYVPPDADRSDPRLSPLLAEDHSGLPPAYVVTAGYDPLHDEGLAYADKLRTAGVKVTHADYDDMIHGFFTMSAVISPAGEAVEAAGKAMKEALS